MIYLIDIFKGDKYMFYNAFINIIILLIYIVIGYFSGLWKFINEEVNDGISKLVLNITMPCMILSSFKAENNVEGMYKNMLILLILYFIFKIMWFIISFSIFTRKRDQHFSTDRFSCLFPNAGYMGIPMTQAIFGDQALIYTSIYVAFFNIFLNSLGVMMFKGNVNFKALIKAFINPAIIAACLGLILFVMKVNLPMLLSKPITALGNMTTPLSFITLGYTLTRSSLKVVFKGKIQYFICALKLLIIPFSAIFIFKPIMGSSLMLDTFILIESMPIAALGLIFVNNFKPEDSEYASKIIFLSTVLSFITVPFVILVNSRVIK